MIHRNEALAQIRASFRIHPIVSLLGPRQCGKTTLTRVFSEGTPHTRFDLEDPVDLRRLDSPLQTLQDLPDLVILDEIQRKPQLFEILRVLVDRPGNPARFLILGSASPHLIRGVSESLAGRVGFVDLAGFNLGEVGSANVLRLWERGGMPPAYLAENDGDSFAWREDFVRTFLERDIPQLGISIPTETLRRFWTMLAHYHGQFWSAAEFARSLGTSEPTARRYLDILAGAYMVRVLPPWFENIAKRQVKSPRIYLRDSGILHALLGLRTLHDVRGHPRLGASWEGFATEQVIGRYQCRDAYFWSTHGGAELDLLLTVDGRRHGFEFKHADAPGRTRSMHSALQDLKLKHLWIVYPGDRRYELGDNVTALPLAHVPSLNLNDP